KIREVVRRRNHVGGDIDVEGGHEQCQHRKNDSKGIAEAREDSDWIPQCPAEDDHRGRSDRDSDEGIESHGAGKAESLAEHLVALAARVASKVRNVEGNGGPEADDSSQGRNEEAEKFTEALELGRRREHGAETPRFAPRPEEEGQSDQQKEGRGDALEEADGF